MDTSIEDIILSKLEGHLQDAKEEALFAEWYAQAGHAERYQELQRLHAAIYAQGKSQKIELEKVWKNFKKANQPIRLQKQILRYAIAACMVCCMITIFYQKNPTKTPPSLLTWNTEKKQVTLTLSNGNQIPLDDSFKRFPTQEKGALIHYDTLNTLTYTYSGVSQELAHNTLIIPRGGEYKLTLSDGTVVWLNSESRLTYPVAFQGHTRELTLEGEAFFKVTADTTKPFIVHTPQFDIRVTGTQFNIRAYPEENNSATLTEGRIQLEKDHRIYRLQSNQQAYLNGKEINITEVIPEDAISWRYGCFSFKRTPLEELMRELARWYDVEIFYQNPTCKNLHFTAWFRRNTPLPELIDILEKTKQIKLELKGKTLIIKKRQDT